METQQLQQRRGICDLRLQGISKRDTSDEEEFKNQRKTSSQEPIPLVVSQRSWRAAHLGPCCQESSQNECMYTSQGGERPGPRSQMPS